MRTPRPSKRWTKTNARCCTGRPKRRPSVVFGFLLAKGATVTRADRSGVTPLHLAAAKPSARILKLFFEAIHPFDPSSSWLKESKGRSPLHYAAAAGSRACCEVLLAQSVPLDQRDSFGQTPLMYAIGAPNAPAVVRLLARKKKFSVGMRNKANMSVLHLAALFGKTEVVEVLINEAEYKLVAGRVEMIETLLRLGADSYLIVFLADNHEATAAHYAAQRSKEALEVLLKKNKQDVVDRKGRTTFMWAVAAQNEEVVGAFLENEMPVVASPNNADKRRQTALHLAATHGNWEICKMLMDQGWQLTAKDNQTATPIHLAAGAGHSELLKYFQQQEFSIDEPDGDGKTPLFYACLGGKAHTVDVLIKDLKADPTRRDTLEQTPLHCAAFVGSAACWSKLLAAGCEMNAVDVNGRTPADFARQMHPKIAFEGLDAEDNTSE
ncbi:Inversin [Aphelenchoides fujianensis]|nr:Inversin [Aphelenchoides fujianensis]